MDVEEAIAEIQRIEGRYAPSPGADDGARRAQLAECRRREADAEFRITVGEGGVGEALMEHLCRRYEIKPFRRPKQHRSTITIQAPRSFVEGVLAPQYQEMIAIVDRAMHATVDRVFKGWLGAQRR